MVCYLRACGQCVWWSEPRLHPPLSVSNGWRGGCSHCLKLRQGFPNLMMMMMMIKWHPLLHYLDVHKQLYASMFKYLFLYMVTFLIIFFPHWMMMMIMSNNHCCWLQLATSCGVVNCNYHLLLSYSGFYIIYEIIT